MNLVGRSGPGARDGAAMLDQVAQVKRALQGQGPLGASHGGGGRFKHVPIISNGNVRTWGDVVANLLETEADGDAKPQLSV